MQLGLSTAAAPDAALAELVAVLRRRGLAALELRQEDGHGLGPHLATDEVFAAGAELRAAGVHALRWRPSDLDDVVKHAHIASALGALVLVDAGAGDFEGAIEIALQLRGLEGAGAVIVSGEDAAERARAAVVRGLDVAWDARPTGLPLGAVGARLLDVAGPRLLHITLSGGGPEVAMQEGMGVGELMGRLALAGYAGALTQMPSSTRYRVAWQTWLGRRGGTGCGSKASDPSLVRVLKE